MLRDKIRKWLGISDLESKMDYITKSQQRTDNCITRVERNLLREIQVHNNAIGRFINKLDPTFIIPQDDIALREESDRIGTKVLERIFAEHDTRRHTEGKA